MKPTIAIQDTSRRQQGHDFSKDFPALFRKPAKDDALRHIDIISEIDAMYRFHLFDERDNGRPLILDTKTGKILEVPTASDKDADIAETKELLFCLAYEIALQHREAVWAAERDLREQETEEQHREFKRLMAYCGRDEHGNKTPERLKQEDEMKLFKWGIKKK